jgi:hypothetical protein
MDEEPGELMRGRAIRVSLVFVALFALSGCNAIVQRSGPLEVRLTKVGAPGGATVAPPAGFDVLRCAIEVVNTSKSTVGVRYKDGELVLYEGANVIGGQREGTSSTAGTAGHELIDSSAPELPGGGTVAVSRDFLVKPDQRSLTLVYRLPGYPDFRWRVR